MRGAISPPSIRLHYIVANYSCDLHLLFARRARSAVTRHRHRQTQTHLYLRTSLLQCVSQGAINCFTLLNVQLNISCSQNVGPCNRLYSYRLLETPTHHNRYYRTRAVIFFGQCTSNAFDHWYQWYGWYSNYSEVMVKSETRRQDRQCIVARSRNDCCRGKTISIKCFHCVFASFLCYITLSSVACLAVPYFFHIIS